MALEDWSTEELGNFYSDYYKDCYGFRPRHISFDDRVGLIDGIKRLEDWFDMMKSTPEGRAELRRDGWVVPEE